MKGCIGKGKSVASIIDPDQKACLMEWNLQNKPKKSHKYSLGNPYKRGGGRGRARIKARIKRKFIQNCLAQKKVGITDTKATLKDITEGTGVVYKKPKSWKECHNRTKSMRFGKGGYEGFMKKCYGSATPIKKGQLEEEVVAKTEEVMPIDAVIKEAGDRGIVMPDSFPSTPEEAKKKKPPYLLYGAVAVVVVLVGMKMLKR